MKNLNGRGMAGLFIMVALVFVVSHPALAGHGKGRGKMPSPMHRMDMLTLTLDLTPEQAGAIEPLLQEEMEEIRTQREAHRGQGRQGRLQAREEIMEIHDEYAELIKQSLTKEQAAKFDKLRDLRHRTREYGPRPENRTEMLSVVLELDEKQEAAIAKIVEAEAKELDAVRGECRGQGRDCRGEARARAREIHDKYEEQIKAELTPEQADKFTKIAALRGEKRGQRKGR